MYEPSRRLDEVHLSITDDQLIVCVYDSGLGEEDFCSLSAEQIDKFEALFHQPEAFVKMGHSITAVPIPDSVLQTRDEHRDAPKLTHSSHDDR